MSFAALVLLSAAASLAAVAEYGRVATRRGIVSVPGARTLHERVVPRGAGIAFAAVFSGAVIVLAAIGQLPVPVLLAFGVGGAAAAVVGFVDDVYDVPVVQKLLCQLGLAFWLLASLYMPLVGPLITTLSVAAAVAVLALLLFVPVWLVNLFNFIDGVDGMAVGAAVLTSVGVMTVLQLTGGDRTLLIVAAVLGASALGFVRANLPPARMFMGDAGSIFLGYSFAALVVASVLSRQMSVWTWLALLAYFVADTTTTTLLRMILVKNFYRGHRSHAYQNLARISGSHGKVTAGVLLYQLLWALPLAVWSAVDAQAGPWAAALAVGPAVMWAVRYGPLLSRA